MKHPVDEREIERPIGAKRIERRELEAWRSALRSRPIETRGRRIHVEHRLGADQRFEKRACGSRPATVVENSLGRETDAAQTGAQPVETAARVEVFGFAGEGQALRQIAIVRICEGVELGSGHPRYRRRASPMTLRKKLARIVCTPSAVSVTPGITIRMVRP